MKILFCVKNSQIDSLKDKPGIHKMSKIKLKFSKPKSISRKEFASVSNIEYVEFNEELRLASLYDRMMDRQLFEASYIDLDHLKIYEEYKTFNVNFFKRIEKQVSENDLVIVNDSSLFFLPAMLEKLKVRVAFRNLRFDGNFIEKVPFYKEILENFTLSQKFFDNKESLESFDRYFECSYEFKDAEKNGCWYIKPYVDKFTVVDTLEHIKGIICNKHIGERYDHELIRYLYNIPYTKFSSNSTSKTSPLSSLSSLSSLSLSQSSQNQQQLNHQLNQQKLKHHDDITILTDVNLLHLEPFIKNNPHIHVRYLRTDIELDLDDSSRMIQYLKKMYQNRFSIADPTNYSQIVSEMFFCDVFVGSQYSEIAKLFGRPVIEESYDPCRLSEEVEECIKNYKRIKYDVMGEEEYLRQFLSVCGYEMVVEQLSKESEMIEKLTDEIRGEKYEVFMKNGEKFIKKETAKSVETLSYDPVIIGMNSYYEVKNKKKPKDLKPIDVEEVVEYWNECLVRCVDGTCGEKLTEQTSVSNGIPSFSSGAKTGMIGTTLASNNTSNSNNTLNSGTSISSNSTVSVKSPNTTPTIILDYDGTLTPIVEDFNAAVPSEKVLDVLRRLNKVARVIICSGRTLEKLDEWIPKEIEIYAEHGAFHRVDGEWTKMVECNVGKTICREVMQYYVKRTPGAKIEEKNTGMTFHYRQAENFCVEKLYTLLRKIAGENVQLGKRVIDLKGSSKGRICREVRPAICIGDDTTDEDMFRECRGISIKIGKGVSFAEGYLEKVEDCINLLERLLK